MRDGVLQLLVGLKIPRTDIKFQEIEARALEERARCCAGGAGESDGQWDRGWLELACARPFGAYLDSDTLLLEAVQARSCPAARLPLARALVARGVKRPPPPVRGPVSSCKLYRSV